MAFPLVLGQVLVKEQLNTASRVYRPFRESSSEASVQSSIRKTDAFTLASKFQLQEEQRELTYALISLFIKSGLLVIGIASFLNLGAAAHQRINRNNEITAVLNAETQKLARLHIRFDSLFSLGGKERLMDDQDQWIAPKSRRIIWR